jgi:hypothetical protein
MVSSSAAGSDWKVKFGTFNLTPEIAIRALSCFKRSRVWPNG